MKKLLLILTLTLSIIGCTSAPISERKQLMLVSEEEMTAQSYQQYAQVMRESKVLNDANAKLVKKVGNNIAYAVERYFAKYPEQRKSNLKYQWEFNLIQNNVPNAWCMPGGKVAVYTGILPYTLNENGLAVVMSHEIAHAVAQHSREQASYSTIQNLGSILLQGFGYNPSLYNGMSNLMMLKYSRVHETEADELGLIFMKLAGYNPEYALEFWKRMKSSSSGGQPEFLSTHPSDDTRIKNIQEYLNGEKFRKITM